ncbi:SDR family oxidoreductase [Spirulina subsalsa FACHB-351]|uniref:SDR family oxidoreductase n=1 Tax=Spirulina subsalsa FACHB-351 TaxID=234711 RepID=A0ABT3L1F4_9CYAN|nr:acetoacetyl-CoA reductase PhaB [Spirulina subsalsa]MCW6035329.1 SDR family oxidoreductase [Spirulina subsalsa FACHB-351]
MVSLGLEDKVIVVTGGNRGIGKAIVNLLLDLGAKVAYTDIVISDDDGKALAVEADVTSLESMQAAAQMITEKLGPVYGVVANAGITRDNFFTKLTDADWDAVINVNLKGVKNTIQPFIEGMYEQNGGSIVAISSISGDRGNAGQANYAATKAAVIGIVKSLARECARYGVRANAIAPGFINTEMTQAIPDKVRDKITAEIPFRRFGEPQDIAWAVAYLLSPVASSYVSGEVLRVNGAHHT